MSRPIKCRKVCCMPQTNQFGPLNKPKCTIESINMTIDEYETIRLIDLQNFTQEETAKQMNIARTTVQKIYNDARIKIADSIVNGKFLVIDGGDYQLCEGNETSCDCGGCQKHNRI